MEDKDHKDSTEAKEEAKITGEATVQLKEEEYLQLKQDAQKAAEYWDRLLRLQADTDNVRKRIDKEKTDFVRFANEGIIIELLNILDDLERTIELAQSKHQDLQAFLKGVEMILAHFYGLLKDYGVKSIDSEGKLFDPHFHEALMQVEDKDSPEHTVVEELQKGYLLNERVIRTAKVKVSKKEQPDK
ncbi:MAG: nucleotide exchange factor GrpE [Candidatus Omnitrophica bacterium]|nr:nucleotide exchange factor GrpE [Candidatus Omnitrophota bacterium]